MPFGTNNIGQQNRALLSLLTGESLSQILKLDCYYKL